MKASVIIPTYGRRLNYLSDALKTIVYQDIAKEEYEVIVVNNNPDGSTAKEIGELSKSLWQGIRCIHAPTGATEARHAGAREARGKILVYTDDDVLVSPGWLKAILEPFKDPKVGCAGGKTIAQWDAPMPSWYAQLGHMAMGMLDLGDKTLELKGCQIWSNNLAVRRSVLYEVGGYNPDIYGGGSNGFIWYTGDGECGLEKKIFERGYKIIYEPRAWIYHRVSAERTTKEYFYRRGFTSAIGSSYSQIRKMRGARFLPIRLMISSGYYFLKSGALFLRAALARRNHVKTRVSAYHQYGKAGHQIRAAFSKKLRDHIFQESYLI